MIIVKNRELLIPNNERYIGTNYDAGMENRVFRISRFSQSGTDLEDLTFKINLIHDGEVLDRAEMEKSSDDDYIYLTWTVTAAQVAVTGTVFVCVTGNDTNDTVKWSSFQAAFYTEKSLGDDIDTQYHELVDGLADEIETREAADNTLQTNINAEASTRAKADSALSVRIDNIVAQAGSDNTEIVDARIGADGTVYDTLGNALRGQVSDLENGITTNSESIMSNIEDYGQFQVLPGTYTTGIYYAIDDGYAVSTSSANWRVDEVAVSYPGIVKASVRTNAGLYTGYAAIIFVDDNDLVVGSVPCDASGDYDVMGLVSYGATKAYVNSYGSNPKVYEFVSYGIASKNEVGALQSAANLALQNEYLEDIDNSSVAPANALVAGYAAIVNAYTNVVEEASYPNIRYTAYPVTAGTLYRVLQRTNFTAISSLIWVDTDGQVIKTELFDQSSSAVKRDVCAPDDAVLVYINSYASNPRCYTVSETVPVIDYGNIWLPGSRKPTFSYSYTKTGTSTIDVTLPSSLTYKSKDGSTVAEYTSGGTFSVGKAQMLVWDIDSNSMSVIAYTASYKNAIVLFGQSYGHPIPSYFLPYYMEYYSEGLLDAEEYSGQLALYQTSMFDTQLTDLRTKYLNIGRTGDTFIFLSDTHNLASRQYQDSPRFIANICKYMPINKVIMGGDMIYATGTEDEMYTEMWEQTRAYKQWISPWARVYNVIGNHDIHITDSSVSPSVRYELTDAQVYAVMFTGQEEYITQNSDEPLGMYYYFDNTERKLRYICLNSCLEDKTAEVSWLTDVMANTDADYDFVIIAHVPMLASQSANYTWNTDLYEVIKTYATRVVGIFSGHVHEDLMEVADGIVHVVIAADSRVNRTASAYTDQMGVLDVAVIDRENSRCDLVRFGYGADRAFTFGSSPAIIDLS